MAKKESSAEYERKRYKRDRTKRIAAERKWQKGNAEYKAKHQIRGKQQAAADPPPTSAACPNCGKTGGRKEFHHTSYKPAKGEWRCSKCNKRPGK
jgi:hypothetical protein